MMEHQNIGFLAPQRDEHKTLKERSSRGASPEALRTIAGDRPEHVEHDRCGSFHHHSTLDVSARWSTGYVGLGGSRIDCDSRWDGVERTRRLNAGVGRHIRLPA